VVPSHEFYDQVLYASIGDRCDNAEDKSYEDLQHVFGQFPMYLTTILLGDFNAKVGRGYFYTNIWEREVRLQEISRGNEIRVVNFSTNKSDNVITFPHRNNYKYTWTAWTGRAV
jgi:hypothetical protein